MKDLLNKKKDYNRMCPVAGRQAKESNAKSKKTLRKLEKAKPQERSDAGNDRK